MREKRRKWGKTLKNRTGEEQRGNERREERKGNKERGRWMRRGDRETRVGENKKSN